MLDDFLNLIKKYEKIIIFRHHIGDGDALGSQWALYYYLKEKYSDKEVYAVGDDTAGYENIFSKPDTLEDSQFENALAIVLDTANVDRISDQRVKNCEKVVKIDHHIKVDNYGDLEIVFPKVSSTAEILANVLRVFENNEPLSKKVANCLYTGIISDTQQFSVSGVNEKTFKTAAYLCESEIDVAKLSRKLNEIDQDAYKFKMSISSRIKIEDRLAYVVICNKDLKQFNISHSQGKRNVNIMKNVEGVDIWVLFYEQKDQEGVFNASIRANEISINEVAQKYGGGGHSFASGVKNLDKEKMNALIKDLKAKIL